MKKKLIIMGSLLCLVVILAGIFMMKTQSAKKYRFEDIVNSKVSKVQIIEKQNGEQEDVDAYIKVMEGYSYKVYKGDLGNTARISRTFKDSDGSVLFIITDIGNRDIISIEIDGESKIYQKEASK